MEIARIRHGVSLPALINTDVVLHRQSGMRFVGLCPFHAEETPSFNVWRDHAHCFGCRWNGDAITWLMERKHMSFTGALRHLRGLACLPEPEGLALHHESKIEDYGWSPILPIPSDAPSLILGGGWTTRIFNPKRAGEPKEWTTLCPRLVHPYRGAAGELLGYVLRCQFPSGKKFTPAITFCANQAGERRWCIVALPRPHPLYRLDELMRRRHSTVLLMEGEKTADAAQRLLRSMVATTWAGGAKAYRHSDWTALAGRKIVCIPDADAEGRAAFHGHTDARGRHVPGILEILASGGAIARCVDPPGALPEGWDLADAEAESWDTARTLAWIKTHLIEPRHATA